MVSHHGRKHISALGRVRICCRMPGSNIIIFALAESDHLLRIQRGCRMRQVTLAPKGGREGGRGQLVTIHFCPGSLLREERSMACTTGSPSVRSVLLSREFGLQGPLEGQLHPARREVEMQQIRSMY